MLVGGTSHAVLSQVNYPHPDGPQSTAGAVFFELLWTSLLIQVVLNVSTPVVGEDEVCGNTDSL